MSSRRPLGTSASVGVVAAALAFATGCGAGTHNETEQERATPYSADADAGTMAVRAVRLVPSTSGTADGYLLAVVVNRGSQEDTLSNATVTGGTVQPAGDASASLTVPAKQSLQFGDPDLGDLGPALAVSGLTQPLTIGTTLHVTLDFTAGGTASLDVPVLSSDDVGTTSTAAPINTTGSYPTPSETTAP